MLNKATNWEELSNEEVSERKSLPVGNYIVRVMGVENVLEKEYVKVYFDIVDGEFAGYFGKISQATGNWSNQGTKYVSYKESAMGLLKQFTVALEKSNKGYIWDWDENKWKGKLFVAVFGEEEYYDNVGELKTSVKLRECRSIEALRNGEIKPVGVKKVKKPTPAPVADTSILSNEDLPF